MCGTSWRDCVRVCEYVCVFWIVLLHDIFAVILDKTAGSDGVAGASHAGQVVEESSAQRL